MPFGRVTEEDVKAAYTDYKEDSIGRGMKACKENSEGLPVSVQISSFPGREALVLSLMKTIEAATKDINDYDPLDL